MVDWKDPEVIAYDFFLYEQIAVFLLGFYGCFLTTWNVEWDLITRRRVFKVVHIPYLLARYITLSALLFFVISGRVKLKIACDVAYRIFAILGSLASMLASLIICSRPITIFRTLKMRTPLYLLGIGGLGQLFLVISQGIWSVRARWDPASHGCAVVAWHSTFLGIQYLYTSVYDAAILLATLWAVRRVHDGRRWGLGDALRVQGLCYLVVTCVANVPVAVLAFSDLNTAMDVLLSMPAMTISVSASSLALLSLKDDELHPGPVHLPTTAGTEPPAQESSSDSGHRHYDLEVRRRAAHDARPFPPVGDRCGLCAGLRPYEDRGSRGARSGLAANARFSVRPC
ncbi:hypothetical protein BD311DRAFT_236920 [Dichomitus squalens]|uniref:G-protein coupled receptors family 3 profile domain-containing protein n=1 Tax=Dichomitus squalens TaxID=114155 RepID=A0A4Q9M6J3_9APHY|nr:hypothetical protein BD311DRAFT_236920 [Dichomitus squalens]